MKQVPRRRHHATVSLSQTAEPPRPKATPYRSPRAKTSHSTQGATASSPHTLKLSIAIGILLALTLIKLFDPVGAARVTEVVNDHVGGDDSAITVEALGDAIVTPGGLGAVLERVSAVFSGTTTTPKPSPSVTPSPTMAPTTSPETPVVSGLDVSELSRTEHPAQLASRAMTWRVFVATPTPKPIEHLSEGALESVRDGEVDDTPPVPFGMTVPEKVDYTVYPLSFVYTAPVAGVTSSGFGYRFHPIQGKQLFHYGTDFAAKSGTDIVSFAAGKVAATGRSNSYGNYILVTHGDGVSSFYAHCKKIVAKLGSQVKKGQVIAKVGSTGVSTGPHLHFELRRNGTLLNPESYVGQ